MYYFWFAHKQYGHIKLNQIHKHTSKPMLGGIDGMSCQVTLLHTHTHDISAMLGRNASWPAADYIYRGAVLKEIWLLNG